MRVAEVARRTPSERARHPSWLALLLIALLAFGCDEGSPAQPPEPSPSPAVVPGQASGPTEIVFVGAEPAPGATLSGCGGDVGGCAGRVRMTFDLRPSRSGFALGFKAFLHNSGMRACLFASTGAFPLQAGVSRTVEVVFDGSDECPTPVDIRNMAAVLEGTVEVASRQEWAIRYTLLP